MSKEVIAYREFFETVPEEQREFVDNLHEYLTSCGCGIAIKEARRGYVVSYIGTDKKVMANYIFRKAGMLIRVYANHLHQYPKVLETFPEGMVKLMDKAGDCKRMLNPDACSSRCPMGYDYSLNGKRYQKCRSMAFQFPLKDEFQPFLRTIMEREAQALSEV